MNVEEMNAICTWFDSNLSIFSFSLSKLNFYANELTESIFQNQLVQKKSEMKNQNKK